MPGRRPPATAGSPMLVGCRRGGGPRRALVVAAAVLALAPAAAACGPDGSAGRPYGPTLPDLDLRPALILVLRDDTVGAEPGGRADPAVRTDPPTVPAGSVIEVRNDAPAERRLRAATSFDTGIMRPGERTTVVVANPGPAALDLPLVVGDHERARLRIEPAPTPP